MVRFEGLGRLRFRLHSQLCPGKATSFKKWQNKVCTGEEERGTLHFEQIEDTKTVKSSK